MPKAPKVAMGSSAKSPGGPLWRVRAVQRRSAAAKRTTGLDLVQSLPTFASVDHHLYDTLDGRDDAGLPHPRRLVRPGRAAGLRLAKARRPLLLRARLELARYDGLVGVGKARETAWRTIAAHAGSRGVDR